MYAIIASLAAQGYTLADIIAMPRFESLPVVEIARAYAEGSK